MNERQDSDPDSRSDLAGRFRRAAAVATPDAADALDRLRPRFEQARRRRRHQTLGALGGLVVLVGGVVLLNQPDDTELRIGGPGSGGERISESSTPPTTGGPSTTAAVASTTPTTSISSSGADDDDRARPSSSSTPPATVPSPVSNPPASTAGDGRVPGPAVTAPAVVTTPSPTTATSPPVPFNGERRFDATGGTVVVLVSDPGGLSLVSAVAKAGFEAEVRHTTPSRIEVRFRSADLDSRVDVRLVNGALVPTIEDSPR